MARDTLSYTSNLTVVTCWCGITHAVPEELRDYQLRQHDDGHAFSIYCPLGHQYHPSGTSEVEKERKRRERAELRSQQLADQLAAAEREQKRLAKRAAAGVCPCCQRSFVQLTRHMKTQHPDYTS
jgi:hypothetical protein